MLNGDLYPKGKMLLDKTTGNHVEYVCFSGVEDLHIVLACDPADCLDDRVREVRIGQLVDATVLSLAELETRRVDAECIGWIRTHQTVLYQGYRKTIGKLGSRYNAPEGLRNYADDGFIFYAVFQFEAQRLKSQMAPGSATRQ